MIYLAVKFVHIMLAITAIGANLTYGVWFARAAMVPAFAPVALRGIKFIDDYIANPAYVLLLPSGALMVWLGGYSFTTFWIQTAMGLWLVAILVAYLGYSPALRRQIAAVDRVGIADPETQRLTAQANVYVAILAVLVIAILVMMVFKPH